MKIPLVSDSISGAERVSRRQTGSLSRFSGIPLLSSGRISENYRQKITKAVLDGHEKRIVVSLLCKV
ncbi:hypothetical protein [Deinococcus altitudinis]|uniref:hypothetical protein n=1 Tax=Deinococcus altitudinis TaxID=468914 RepID=UPI003892628E